MRIYSDIREMCIHISLIGYFILILCILPNKIGNLNPFNGYNTVGYNYIQNYLNQSGIGSTYSEQLDSLKASIYSDSSMGESFMKNIGFSIDDMLFSCYFNKNECNKSDFTLITTYDRGNCYMFNFGTENIKTSSQTGQYYGLKVELFSGFDGNNCSIIFLCLFYVFKIFF